MKLLLVEDEAPAAHYLARGLGEEGFTVEIAATAGDARERIAVNAYDLVILDVRLPGEDGFSLCRHWRAAGLAMPILFLTANDDVADRVRGLDSGGDDYLVKPFAFEELLARVRALLRRGAVAQPSPLLTVGELVLDPTRRRVTRAGKPITLTARELQLLEHFMRHPGEVVTRTALWEAVWESHSVPDSNVVDVYVRYLRNKLGRDPDLIRTYRGGGYVLEAGPAARREGA